MSAMQKKQTPVKITLTEDEMPRQWYNIAADFKTPMLPPLGPDGKPVTPEMMSALFPMNLIEQEMSSERWVDIPEELLGILYRWRPSPLHRAYALEALLDTPARIYYKNESVSPVGSHKLNTAIAQAYYNKKPAPDNGEARFPMRAPPWVCPARCTW